MKKFSQTIIIPTRNRAETAMYAVESCLRVNYENKQIIVVDNGDDCSLKTLLNDAGYMEHIDYHKNKQVLSMRDNWERGLELADGDLVSVMGDDDAILNSSMHVANFVFNRAEIDVLSGSSAIYKWPTYPFQGRRNYLYFQFGENVTIYKDPHVRLKEAYTYTVTMGTGPGLYYGFVKKEFLNRLKRTRGKYLIDKIPDFDSGYCTLLYANAYALSKRPLFIQGHSGKSNSGSMRFAASQKKNIEIFAQESDESIETIFKGALADVRSNNAVIVSAQLRFQSEVEKVLGHGAVTLNKEEAWRYIMKGLAEGYDVVEFIASVPALKRLSEEWGVPYTLTDKFEPFVGDSALNYEQGFIKSKPLSSGESMSVESEGYGSVVVNGAAAGFHNIMDAVRHIDAMLPTMRASPDQDVSACAIEQLKQSMEAVLIKTRHCIKTSQFNEALVHLDEIIAAGEIGLPVDAEVEAVALSLQEYEWGSRYFARRFSATGGASELARLTMMYQKMGADELLKSLQEGLGWINIEE